MKKSLVAIMLVAPAILGINSAIHALLPASPKAAPAPIHRQVATRPPLLLSSLERGILPITRTATPTTTRRLFKPAPDAADPNPFACKPDSDDIHRINEASIIVSPTGASTGSVDMTYCAFMRYPDPASSLHGIHFEDIVTSRPASGGEWTLNALEPSDSVFDNSGDPALAANPTFGPASFHPHRIYLAATNWKAGTTNGETDPEVHLQNQITVWSYDPADDTNHLHQWTLNDPINPHFTATAANYDFDDGPTIAVSQATNTRGHVYVAYKLTAGDGSGTSIHFARGFENPNDSTKVAWDDTIAVPTLDHNLHIPDNPRLVVDPTGRIFLSWLDHADHTVNVMVSHNEGQDWSYYYHNLGGESAWDKIGNFPGQYASLHTGNFVSTCYSTKSGTLLLVYQRKKDVWYTSVASGPMNPYGSEVVIRRFDPVIAENQPLANPFSDPIPVSNRDVTSDVAFHDQWGGVLACGPDGGCLVSYYDHDVKDEASFVNPATTNLLFRYALEARHFKDLGASLDGGTAATPLVLSNSLSDSSQFFGNVNASLTPGGQHGSMEYQDTFYRNGTWYTASVLTEGSPSSTSHVVANTISCGAPSTPRIHAVKPLDNLPFYPRGWSGNLSVDLNTGDSPYVTWTEKNAHLIITTRPEHGSTITVQPGETTTYTAVVTDFCGNPVQNSMTITICPTISVAPASASATIPLVGEGSVSANVAANGEPAYTWYDGDTNTPISLTEDTTLSVSAGGDTITLHSAAPRQRKVWARVSSCGRTVDSDTVTLTLVTSCVSPQLYIAGSGSILGGQFQTLTAYLDPLPTDVTPTYQWYRGSDSAPMPCTEATCNVTTQTYDTFYCVVTIKCDKQPDFTITSPKAYLWVYGLCEMPPFGVSQSATNIPANSPHGVTFTAQLDWADISFQWYKGQSGDTSHPVNSGSGPQNPITVGVGTDGPAAYWVRGSLPCGAFRDSETMTFTKGGCPAVLFSPQPQSAVIQSGDGPTLTVDTPLTPLAPSQYHWQTVNVSAVGDYVDVPMTDQGKSVQVHPLTTTRYRVIADNVCSNAESAIATIRVGSCSSINVIQWPDPNPWVNQGQSATLSVTATPIGSGTLTYQWYAGEVGDESHLLLNETASVLHTGLLNAPAKYWVRLKNTLTDGSFCYADSPTASVSVCVPPTGSDTPIELQVTPWSQTARLYYPFTGTALTYQWYQGTPGNVGASEAITGSADTTVVRPSYTTTYWVRAASHCPNDPNGQPSTSDSPAIRVSVCPVFIQQPLGPTSSVMAGQTTTLTAESHDNTDVFQWYVGDTGDTSQPFGAHALTVTTPPITADTKFWVRATSGTCTTNSVAVTVHLCAPLPVQWATIPRPLSPVEPFTISISGVAGQENVFWYQGQSGDQSHPTGSPANLPYSQVGPLSQTTSFWARVQNGTCYTDLPTLTLPVCVPVISQDPASSMINSGGSAALTVTAAPSAVTYQWYTGNRGDTSHPIAGATTSGYTAHPAVTTSYWVRVDGGCGVTVDSAAATVSICQEPAIQSVTPPLSIVHGQNTTLLVNATGTNLTYQWYVGNTGVTTLPVNGATNAMMTVAPQDNISYWVRVSGSCSSRDSATIPVSVCWNPEISTQPQSVFVFSGAAATLSVAATEAISSPVTYQWYRGNTGDTSNLAGTGASFTTPPLTAQTSYWARATCGVCTPADSQTATVSICPIPSSLSSPGNVNVSVGQSGHLSTITGTGNTYQWYAGASGNTSVGAPSTTSTLDIAPSVTTSYWCRVTNGTCVTNTPSGTINVCIPTFTQVPHSITINAGSSTTLTSAANTAGVTYQWYVGATGNTASPVSGATTANLTVTPSSTTSYWVRATGTCAPPADSPAATVTVCQTPALVNPPHDSSGIYGSGNAYFTVTASGSNLTYQWYTGDSGTTTQPISGATSNALTLAIGTTTKVWVRVSGQCGVIDSATVWASVYPTAQQTPSSLTVGYNSTGTLNVSASGTYLHYVWKWANGTAIAGAADSPTLITPSIVSDSAIYCEVWSGAVQTSSSQTALSVCYDQPTIYSLTKANNGSCKIVSISTSSAYDYQWYQGVRGDLSHPVGSGSPTIYPCPTGTTQYWCRVFTLTQQGTASGCYIDSSAITVP